MASFVSSRVRMYRQWLIQFLHVLVPLSRAHYQPSHHLGLAWQGRAGAPECLQEIRAQQPPNSDVGLEKAQSFTVV
jgi:hypothetical protein